MLLTSGYSCRPFVASALLIVSVFRSLLTRVLPGFVKSVAPAKVNWLEGPFTQPTTSPESSRFAHPPSKTGPAAASSNQSRSAARSISSTAISKPSSAPLPAATTLPIRLQRPRCHATVPYIHLNPFAFAVVCYLPFCGDSLYTDCRIRLIVCEESSNDLCRLYNFCTRHFLGVSITKYVNMSGFLKHRPYYIN